MARVTVMHRLGQPIFGGSLFECGHCVAAKRLLPHSLSATAFWHMCLSLTLTLTAIGAARTILPFRLLRVLDQGVIFDGILFGGGGAHPRQRVGFAQE